MADQKFQLGDPVWSKMKGYCAWPSRIAAQSETNLKLTTDKKSANKTHHLVYFFGSNNYAWMPEDSIKPYEELKEKNKNGSKSAQFKSGLKLVEEYIANGGKATLSLADSTTGSTMKNSNSDNLSSPVSADESPNNDASNLDDLRQSKTSRKLSMSIEEELQLINTVTPATIPTKRSKNSNDSHNNDSSSLSPLVPSSVQKDYSRTPFKSRKTKSDESSTEITSPTKRAKTFDDESYDPPGLSSSSSLSPAVFSAKQAPKSNLRNIMMRPQLSESALIESPKINLHSATAKSKTIRPSSLKFGFIGLGFMGQRLLKNLLDSKHKVIIWNRSTDKCNAFCEAGAESASTPADVVAAADVVFGCLSDVTAIKEIMFGSFGILTEMCEKKGYVEMGSTDPETSKDVFEAILQKGGQYLEAPSMLSGRKAAEDGELVIVTAGDKKLYEVCHTCFQAMAKRTFYLSSEVGVASRMKLVIAILYGAFYGALSESYALLDRVSIEGSDFAEIIKLLPINSPLMEVSLEKMIKKDFSVNIPSEHLQKDLRKALNASDEHLQSLPITAVVNEIFKKSMKGGYTSQSDAAALFVHTQY